VIHRHVQVIGVDRRCDPLKIETMKKFLCIAVLAVLVSACQTTNQQNSRKAAEPFIGEGAVTLSVAATRAFKDEYLRNTGPEYFLLSKDGKFSSYLGCFAGTGNCNAERSLEKGMKECGFWTGIPCPVFAIGKEIVWKGDVSFWGKRVSVLPTHPRIALPC
jgi:hypothetical protein